MYRKPLALAAALLLLGGATAQADTTLVLTLPPPTGPHPVGVTELHLSDASRPDPWDSRRPARELMVSVFYPAAATDGFPLAPQMTPRAAAVFGGLDAVHTHPELPDTGVDWAATMTHSHVGAPAQPRRRPVLLYSPGAGDPRTLGTGLAEDLASRGYVVVTIDHAGETTEVEFPSGEVRITEMRSHPGFDPELFRKLLDIRLADVTFVLDRLRALSTGTNPDADGKPLPATCPAPSTCAGSGSTATRRADRPRPSPARQPGAGRGGQPGGLPGPRPLPHR
ncbi:hypothetical protein ACFQV2_08085 [Actinokineospora soli]|uniref:Platelet-activating factor acetylhydrolase n=1 Tax=Actinokineospora soli TaxID=1048753 RepID=A0ABW2TKL0_9PSEU